MTCYASHTKFRTGSMDVIRDWRIDRYYASKVKLLDLSLHLN
ncbi:MAG: hypothetical protein QM527_05590 [Alphaproteobacteria bacterium]|nr:hypothetical protein [Alphaproteobacteria bacterium]